MPFEKGKSGNPSGRPSGSKTKFSIIELEKAIKEVEDEYHMNFFKHVVQQAFKSERVLIALLKKLIPDIQHVEVSDDDLINTELEFFPSRLSKEQIKGLEKFYYK